MTAVDSSKGVQTEPGVLYEVKDQIATITINDPKNMNATGHAVRTGLWDAFRRFNNDKSALVAILTGAGERAFCAGANLKEFADDQVGHISASEYYPMPGQNIMVEKPWIAAVNGYALGGGLQYTMLADMAIAAEHAQFGIPEVKLSRGAPWSVPMLHQVPRKIWTEMAICGDKITAQRAYEVGFINAVVPASELMKAAREMATKLVKAAPLTVLATLKVIKYATEMGASAAKDVAWEIFEPVYLSADAIEGPLAFKEKREPHWQGK